MKKYLLLSLALFFLFSINISAQLVGIKTIPGDYASVAEAITALNTSGVGTGGVTFNVAAGHTETFASSTAGVITATGTASNQIVFQKSGVGANPLITAGLGIIASSTTIGANGDGIIIIEGGDYITFDGINLQDNPTATDVEKTEYGYFLKKASAEDAPKNITIKNCTITLDKTTIYSWGIYVSNLVGTDVVTVTSLGGRSENIKIFNNNISDAYGGIQLRGFAAVTPFDFYDQNIEVGVDGANIITNVGGGASIAYGIYTIFQDNLKLANNTVSSAGNSTVYGIFTTTANNASADIYNNIITTEGGGTTSATFGLSNGMGANGTSNTINIYGNILENSTYPTATTGAFYGLSNGASAFTVNFYDNIVRNNIKSGTSGAMYLLYNQATGTGGFSNIYNNFVYGNTNATTGLLYCVYSNESTSTTKMVYSNTVYNNTGGGKVYGVTSNTGILSHVYKNNVYNLTSTSTGTASPYSIGISVGTGTNVYVYNNFISDLKAPDAPAVDAVRGIEFTSATANATRGVYYNTIFLNASSSGANFGSSGIYHINSTLTTSSVLDMRNNNVVNISTPSGTGNTVAFRRSAVNAALSNYSEISNNNNFYAGIPSATNLIFFDGTNADQTLDEFKLRVSPRESVSITGNPPFINAITPPYNLRINPLVPTQLESAGTPITTPIEITTDYDDSLRNTSTPDIGADEFDGLFADLTPPAIVYTSLINTGSTANRDITATITDPSGVQAGTNGPRLYFKKNFDGTYLFDATPVVVGDDYTFTIDQTTLGVVAGDSVYYYFAAQDSLGNAGTNPPGGSGSNPPGTTPPDIADAYLITPPALSGDYTIGVTSFRELSGINITFKKRVRTIQVEEIRIDPVKEEQIGIYEETLKGTVTLQEPADEAELLPVTITRTVEQDYYVPMFNGEEYDGLLYYEFTAEDKAANSNLRGAGVYPTITAALADANLRGVAGPVNFILLDATYPSETFPIVIGEIFGVDSNNTITLRPDLGVTSSISGTINQPIFDFVGASYFIIDGRSGGIGTTINLTIENLSTTSGSHTIRLGNGSTYNTIRYATLINNTQATAGPRVVDIPTSPTNPLGNSFNIIEYCDIIGGRTGIGFAGTVANPNTDNMFIGNKISDFSFAGIWFSSNASNTTVEGNEFFHTQLYNVQATAISLAASANQGVTNIIGNKFYDLQNSTTTTLRAISGTPGTLSTINIVNNFFSLTLDNGTKTSIYAVQISGTTEYIVNAYYNSFRSGGVHTGGTAGVLVSGGLIKSNTGAASTFNAKNNISINTRTGGTAGVIHTNFFAGTTALVGTLDIDYNVWYATGDPGSYSAGWNNFVYNDQQTYRDSTAPHEQNTIFKDVHFVSNTDLHLDSSSVGDLDFIGLPIAGITTDIDGELRHLEFPYRGADEGNIPLPVELTSFAGSFAGNSVSLTWSTATEINNNGFEVQRKLDQGWENLGFVKGKGTTTELSNYSFSDTYDFVAFTGAASYRLKQIDFDGSYNYSKTIEVEVNFTPTEYALYQNYPNPFNPATIIKYSLPYESEVKIVIHNLLGEKIAELVNENQATGNYEISWNAGNVASGIYFYSIHTKSTEGQQEFKSVKKMLLMK